MLLLFDKIEMDWSVLPALEGVPRLFELVEQVLIEREEWGGITTFSKLLRNESLSRLYISSQYVSCNRELVVCTKKTLS